ncbi:MAG: sulfite exporter TauE/SafE family protein [Desulfobacteraceae bacterium]|nr:sulfite exporter TauE/SafE family protein [Desulfobacteraceae bacterium]
MGLLSSGHCIGMCGPLVLAIPASTGKWTAHIACH